MSRKIAAFWASIMWVLGYSAQSHAAIVYLETDYSTGQGYAYNVGSDCYVFTPYHNVDRGARGAKIFTDDGKSYDVKLLAQNRKEDIAILTGKTGASALSRNPLGILRGQGTLVQSNFPAVCRSGVLSNDHITRDRIVRSANNGYSSPHGWQIQRVSGLAGSTEKISVSLVGGSARLSTFDVLPSSYDYQAHVSDSGSIITARVGRSRDAPAGMVLRVDNRGQISAVYMSTMIDFLEETLAPLPKKITIKPNYFGFAGLKRGAANAYRNDSYARTTNMTLFVSTGSQHKNISGMKILCASVPIIDQINRSLACNHQINLYRSVETLDRTRKWDKIGLRYANQRRTPNYDFYENVVAKVLRIEFSGDISTVRGVEFKVAQ